MANGDNAENDPFVDPEATASQQSQVTEGERDDAATTLACDRNVALTLGKEGLIIIGMGYSKLYRYRVT